MDRRSAIKKFLIFSAGAAFVPGCLEPTDAPSTVPLNNIKVSKRQEELLAEISETIIPKTESPGARDVAAHAFVLIMIDDCRGKDDQEKFLSGLEEFEKYALEQNDKSFNECSPDQRLELLKKLDRNKDESNLSEFYHTVRHLTLEGYLTSQYYLTAEQPYELVPGRFAGCTTISEVQKKNF